MLFLYRKVLILATRTQNRGCLSSESSQISVPLQEVPQFKKDMKEDPRHIRISELNYLLPDERIAKFPLPVRDQSKLLLYRHGEVFEDVFTSLPDYLPADSLMIFNNTKVIQARLHFHKETGALIEVFCLEPIRPNDYAPQFPANGKCRLALHDRKSEEMERRSAET